MTDQLIPKLPRRMKQPRKELLRDAVAALTAENIELRAENDRLRRPWWSRLLNKYPAPRRQT